MLHFLDNCVRIIYIQGHGIPWGFPTLYVEIPYLVNIHGQYINIHDRGHGFPWWFFNIYTVYVQEVFDGSIAFTLLEDQICRLRINIHDVAILWGFLTYFICAN